MVNEMAVSSGMPQTSSVHTALEDNLLKWIICLVGTDIL